MDVVSLNERGPHTPTARLCLAVALTVPVPVGVTAVAVSGLVFRVEDDPRTGVTLDHVRPPQSQADGFSGGLHRISVGVFECHGSLTRTYALTRRGLDCLGHVGLDAPLIQADGKEPGQTHGNHDEKVLHVVHLGMHLVLPSLTAPQRAL